MSIHVGNPRKKRRVRVNREPPFPVPIATISGESASDKAWFYYTGEFHGNHVVVKHSGDMDFLYKMGFFGKGSLSKSKPDFALRSKCVDIPLPSGETTSVKITKRRSYVRHMKWRRLEKNNNASSDDLMEYDSSVHVEDETIISEENHEHASPGRTPQDQTTWKDTDEDFLTSTDNHIGNSQPTVTEDWAETDNDFWTSRDDPMGNSQPTVTKDWAETDEDFWGSTPVKTSIQSEKICGNSDKTMESESRMYGDNDKILQSESRMFDKSNVTLQSEGLRTSPGKNRTNEVNSQPLTLDRRKESDVEAVRKDEFCESNDKSSENKQEIVPSQDITEKSETDCRLDPLCEEEEEDEEGDVLVIEDSDSETEGRYRKLSKQKWLPVLKKDAYPMKEFLHLSLEEAFFLSFGLGCLIVTNNGKTLGLQSMWTMFCEVQKDFLPHYVAYHYFRSLGWVPKSGLKFGTDFILYKVGPPFYHGSYSVVVKMINEEDMHTIPEVTGVKGRDLSWTCLAGLNRITEHVAKELMMCYVIKPRGLTTQDLKCPSCISKLKVQQLSVKRWIPSQERQESRDEGIP
ncbi:tRNA-splicing endonuclease subunit Sen2-like [Argopecten irradians]|uniref:tRNA-splicing endonuclease subunit Sen2-like n=1 Tax=Argopecten irradians TaxID=31199 RepID=UPI0037163659